MVDPTGFEPATSCMPCRRSAAELRARSCPYITKLCLKLKGEGILFVRHAQVRGHGLRRRRRSEPSTKRVPTLAGQSGRDERSEEKRYPSLLEFKAPNSKTNL